MTKLLFFLAVWKRPEITEICFMGLNRLKKSGKYPMEFLAVISEDEMIPLCEKYGVDWVMHENLPLGKKKNFGLQEAMKRDFDYLIEIGSDDIIKTELLDLYEPCFAKGFRFFGVTSFAFINSKSGESKVYRAGLATTFGLGRAFKREVIEQIGKLWPDDRSKGLDNTSHFNLAKHGIFGKRINTEKPLAIDLKSEVNIWAFDTLSGDTISFDEAVEGLSEEEIESIKALQHAEV